MSVLHAPSSIPANDGMAEVSGNQWLAAHVIDTLDLTAQTSDPASPTDGSIWYNSTSRIFRFRENGLTRDWQPGLAHSNPTIWKAQPASTALSAIGNAVPTALGTATSAPTGTTNKYAYYPKLEWLVTTPATNAIAGFYKNSSNFANVTVGGPSAGLGGFYSVGQWGPATGVFTTTQRAFMGLAASGSAPTDVEPSTLVSMVGMGWDAADTNIQIMCNDGSGTATKTDLGASFPVPTSDRTALYELELFSPPGTTQTVLYKVTDMISGATSTGTLTTNLPTTSTRLMPQGWVSAGGTSSVVGFMFVSLYLDPLL